MPPETELISSIVRLRILLLHKYSAASPAPRGREYTRQSHDSSVSAAVNLTNEQIGGSSARLISRALLSFADSLRLPVRPRLLEISRFEHAQAVRPEMLADRRIYLCDGQCPVCRIAVDFELHVASVLQVFRKDTCDGPVLRT